MYIGSIISRLRHTANLSQEKFAETLGLSRQAVQKWENGTSMPDINNIISIAKFFNVSIDTLLLGSDKRIAEEMSVDKIIQPQYKSIHQWELYSADLMIEYRQTIDEGKDISQYKNLFKAVADMPVSSHKEDISNVLYNIVLNAKQVDNYAYVEPSELEEIRSLRPEFEYKKTVKMNAEKLRRKIAGAWTGRICGCLLGKPVEGIKSEELHPILKESGNYPMYRYIHSADITEKMCDTYSFRLKDKCYADTISCAPVDDDTNYTVLSAELIKKYGRDFTSYDVSKLWLACQPKDAYCTAERVAFRNFVDGYYPPNSAIYKNPYHEWIGAQIRGDYFGYINPGNAELAAEMAWRDASISHVKNGIYGEMFIAAMLAYAAVDDHIEQVVLGGLAQIPLTSRLYKNIMDVLSWYREGVSEKKCFEKITEQFDEHDSHDWCHTISNAMIVVTSLLYGNGDFGKTVCAAVQTCFDTDCNGATAGSIVGMINGIECISENWSGPINGVLDTSIFGVGKVKISDMIDITMEHIGQI